MLSRFFNRFLIFGKKIVLVLVGMAFFTKLFTHFHASYMEYSRGQTLKAYKSYKIVLSYEYVIVFYIVLWKLRTYFEISAWNGYYVKGT